MLCVIENEQQAFERRAFKYRGLLLFVSRRIVGGGEAAEEAVANCLFIAAHSEPESEGEGAFRGWLLRVLIDEALRIRYWKKEFFSLHSGGPLRVIARERRANK